MRCKTKLELRLGTVFFSQNTGSRGTQGTWKHSIRTEESRNDNKILRKISITGGLSFESFIG